MNTQAQQENQIENRTSGQNFLDKITEDVIKEKRAGRVRTKVFWFFLGLLFGPLIFAILVKLFR